MEAPGQREGIVSENGSATKVDLFLGMFSCGLRLPYLCPISEVLYYFRLAPAHLHPNAWQILICYCVIWQWALLKSDPENADLTYREFLLTHNIQRGIGEIYSFKEWRIRWLC